MNGGEDFEERLAEYEARLAALTRRVYELERGAAPVAAPMQAPVAPLLHQQPLTEVAVPRGVVAPGGEAAPAGGTAAGPDVAPGLGVTASPGVAAARDAAETWESSLGTNWLTRSGVLLIVIGVVLFLGYAMTGMGPAGRVVVAAGAAVAMLATGYYFEGKGGWRPWSLAMIAGGFAVLYTTAYAAHSVPAAKIIANHTVGAILQSAIAVAAIFAALRFSSQPAVMLAFLAAFTGVLSTDTEALRFLGCIPLTLAGIWLAERNKWDGLSWSVLFYTWMAAFATADKLPESKIWGQPGTWFVALLFSGFEIYRRTKEKAADQLPQWHLAWLAANAAACFAAHVTAGRHHGDAHVFHILGLMALFGTVTSLARIALGVRREALSEALALCAAGLWVALDWLGPRDPLLAFVIVLALSMAALYWNHLRPAAPLQIAGEVVLGTASLLLLFVFPDSKKIASSPLTIRLALPQITLSMLCLFAAGRWFSATPWPSWMALITLAEITLWTVPETIGTIVLALEAIAAVAAGLYLDRRPIRLGGLALFGFSVLKVFLYDLSELSTLPRIFSFIVLGVLLLGASWGYTRYRRELQKYL